MPIDKDEILRHMQNEADRIIDSYDPQTWASLEKEAVAYGEIAVAFREKQASMKAAPSTTRLAMGELTAMMNQFTALGESTVALHNGQKSFVQQMLADRQAQIAEAAERLGFTEQEMGEQLRCTVALRLHALSQSVPGAVETADGFEKKLIDAAASSQFKTGERRH